MSKEIISTQGYRRCGGEKQGATAVHTRQTWLTRSSGKACQGGNTYTGTRGGVFQVEGAAMRKGPEVEEELRSRVQFGCSVGGYVHP